eukprot:2778758-Rhodomonas_salina.1
MRWQGTSMYSGSAQTRKLMSPSPHDPPHPSARQRLAARDTRHLGLVVCLLGVVVLHLVPA